MGSDNSAILDAQGKQVVRKCIILVVPPMYQVSELTDCFPEQFPYRYLAIGEMIRNEINKKTKYSKIILENLEKDKKVNKKILQILMRTAALKGDFIIRYSVLDKEELQVWKSFMSHVKIQLIAIVKPLYEQETSESKQLSYEKMKEYKNDVRNVKQSFNALVVRQYSQNQDIAADIMNQVQEQ